MEPKETAVQYLIRQLRYAYDAKKAGTFNGELDVDDVEYFGEIALQMEKEQIEKSFENGQKIILDVFKKYSESLSNCAKAYYRETYEKE